MRNFIIFTFLTTLIHANPLTKEESSKKIAAITEDLKNKNLKDRALEFENKVVKHGDKTMRYEYLKYGEEPEGGHSLYISMHGGGNAPAAVNDSQWQNQIKLYKPKEGYYVAPRAPTNTWNLWHEAHINPLFDKLIENFVIVKGVNPNKIYLTGYSAGGDGTYQVAPRMADRFAAAAMMAGHPNEAKPDNLMNLPFFIQCGGRDTAYNRNKIAKEWGDKLSQLEKTHPGKYVHKTIIYPELGHWMNGKDKVAIPWMAQFTRNPWPKQIVWSQDDVLVKRFYWLKNENPKLGQHVEASVKGQSITIDSENVDTITLRLSDALIDLDNPITVISNGKTIHKGTVKRDQDVILNSLTDRYDPSSVATAELKLEL